MHLGASRPFPGPCSTVKLYGTLQNKRNCSSPLRELDGVMRVDVTTLAGIQGWDDAAS